MRSASSWTRNDSLVVLASYLARPAHMSLPPAMERAKVADQLGVSVSTVTNHLWMFAELDPANPTLDDGHADHDARALWRHYRDDPIACFEHAERIVERRKPRPRQLFGDAGPML